MPPATKESFARALDALVRKYEADRDTYLSSQYNEAQTRTQFITPLLEALGWDVRNEAGVPYNLCEVLEEKGETHGRPDYTFRINGQTKFFLEAKSPSDELSSASIIQTKRYAWNSRDIFFAGVCDFEQFKFFDASLRPDDKRPDDGEAFHLIYSEYASHIDKLWELSRDRVAAGSLDQFLRKDRKSLLQKVPVDKDFLDNLTIWRHDLANAIHAQNPQYDAHQLNDIVQRLLDRIIFIRIAEDRKVIDQRQLWDIAVIWDDSGGRRNIMEQLVQVFQDFNTRFNGEIFKPHPCEEIKIESHALVKIIKQLYPPKSNYRFDVIGVELLGSIYERYLGNTLRITPKRVHIEPKPEVRKAGGVYYTPQYIVDYIVKNTVGKLVEGKTPKEADKIRILDPACGSGSFLIGAFQFLIDWYLNYYREHPKEAAAHGLMPQTRTDQDGNVRLSFYAKSLIIQHNLYGVDIDPQAVEVTMMSLYLKMLEGELGIQIPKQDKLPELKYNIRCGNSLIGPDIEKDSPAGAGKPLSPEDRLRINPFDWNSRENGFGDILKSGGFDAVIGNPPWGYDFSEVDLGYLRLAFRSVIVRMIDSFMFFAAKAATLLQTDGRIGMIVPDVLLYQVDNFKLREMFLEKFQLTHVANLGDRVFIRVTRPSCIFIAQLRQPDKNRIELIDASEEQPSEKKNVLSGLIRARLASVQQTDVYLLPGKLIPVVDPHRYTIWFKIKKNASCVRLEDLVDADGIQRGVSPDLKEAFIVDSQRAKTQRLEKPFLRKVLLGGDIKRYRIDYAERIVLYLTGSEEPKKIPHIRAFVGKFKNRITCTEVRDHKHSLFALHRARQEHIFLKKSKLVGVITEDEPIVAKDDAQLFATDGAYLFALRDPNETDYVLAIMNSKLTRFLYRLAATETGRVLAQVKPAVLNTLPICSRPAAPSHRQISALAERMLELNKKKHSDQLAPAELQRLEREIADTDAEIDNLVYDLYAITPEERKIIEAQP